MFLPMVLEVYKYSKYTFSWRPWDRFWFSMFGSLSNQIFKEDYISALIESIVHLKKYQESYLNCLIFYFQRWQLLPHLYCWGVSILGHCMNLKWQRPMSWAPVCFLLQWCSLRMVCEENSGLLWTFWYKLKYSMWTTC